MLIINQYTIPTEVEGAACPLCGEEVEMRPARSQYDLHHFYCSRCEVDFTIGDRVRDYEEERVRNIYLDEAIERWNMRTEADPGTCPFCGGEVYEPFFGQSLFDKLECPDCRMRFEFQSHPHSKMSMRRTLREFRRRPDLV